MRRQFSLSQFVISNVIFFILGFSFGVFLTSVQSPNSKNTHNSLPSNPIVSPHKSPQETSSTLLSVQASPSTSNLPLSSSAYSTVKVNNPSRKNEQGWSNNRGGYDFESEIRNSNSSVDDFPWFRPGKECFDQLDKVKNPNMPFGTNGIRPPCELDGEIGPYCPIVVKEPTPISEQLLHKHSVDHLSPFPKKYARENQMVSKKADRIRIYNELRGFLHDVDAHGDVLGVSGEQLFDSFNFQKSRFTMVDYPVADCHNLPFGNDIFDYVVVQQVLEHVPHYQTCIHEFRRVLKPGGHILFASPATWPLHPAPRDYWRFMPDSIPVMFKCFSRIILQGHQGNADGVRALLDAPNSRSNPKLVQAVLKENDFVWSMFIWAIVQK
eukprot:CAMPEP_0196581110 /NCGR_PEP_ID=MMETSP1081-20130531/32454_1 /TAXON_ID=36882 /ORGANISM="Pyramimonas amylifera, Strain CCMP720" /LENGTH=380 /DNA_ID=CAMNT_0041901215 /DNA_START=66 /DNA_END=1208 /DNA_ORIENTATION=-